MNHNRKKLRAALRAVRPFFEITPLVRPRLVLAAILPNAGPILFVILYHTKKNAFQSRLRFRGPDGRPEVLRATTWRTFTDSHAFDRYKEEVIQGFATMAAALGGRPITLEFAASVSDDDILEAFLSSGIFDVLR
jgi:hypothetical protein